MTNHLAEQIDALLPQTQCTKCGYQGCRPYAQAIAKGKADINQCPPGGEPGITKLAALLGVNSKPLNPEYGIDQPRQVAVIDEQECIGCTKCQPPCPVDAIIGANKLMHTVIESECTGCELCIAPCPVNCITMQTPQAPFEWNQQAADHARSRYRYKQKRQQQAAEEKAERLKKQKQMLAKMKLKKQAK